MTKRLWKKQVFLMVIIYLCVILHISPAILAPRSINATWCVAEADTYVCTKNATSNYGKERWLYTGLGLCNELKESYFRFNFSNKPLFYNKALINLRIHNASEMMQVNISLINEDWGEYSMRWNNKPNKSKFITAISVPALDPYQVDVTEYVEGKNTISISVEIGNFSVNDYIIFTSREGNKIYGDAPQLIWLYLETKNFQNLIGLLIIITIGGLLIFLISLKIRIKNKLNRKIDFKQ